jgi:hypothetical protein
VTPRLSADLFARVDFVFFPLQISRLVPLKRLLLSEEQEIRLLRHELLNSWNQYNASAFAALFVEDGQTVGFEAARTTGGGRSKTNCPTK